MITVDKLNDAFTNILDKLEEFGISLPDVTIKLVDFNLNGCNATYSPTEKVIKVWKKTPVGKLYGTIAHEVCHAIERAEGPKILTGNDLSDLLHIFDKYDVSPVKPLCQQFIALFDILSKVWTNEAAANKTVERIEDTLEDIQEMKMSSGKKYPEVFNWFAANYDAIYDSIDYYEVGGHNDVFLDAREDLEDMLGIDIPIAEN